MAIIKVANRAIDLDAAEIPNIDASKITSGSLADARIPNLATSKITSGTFADARIAASNVSQHAQSFDDNKIVNDISTIALRQASNENKGAYNTNSMYVDVFQDSTGITGLTQASRSADEYMSTIVIGASSNLNFASPSPSQFQYYTEGFSSNNSSWYNLAANSSANGLNAQHSRDNNSGGHFCCATSAPTSNSGFSNQNVYAIIDFKESKYFPGEWQIGKENGYGDMKHMKFQYSNDNSSYTDFDFSNAVINNPTPFFRTTSITSGGSGGNATVNSSYTGVLDFTQHSVQYYVSINTITNIAAFSARYIKVIMLERFSGTANANAGFKFTPKVASLVANSSGSFESNAITAPSSTNKMGAIITYQDNAGVNALNTDVILKLSADGGSNYTTATMTAMPDFATGIKMAKVNDLSVTAGTSLKYKLEFANQASGSKEARIRGVSLQY